MNILQELFPVKKPIIGMVHSLPLPGSPDFKKYNLPDIYDYCVEEAMRLIEGGVDGLMIENAGDIPFVKSEYMGPETAACIAIIGERIRRETNLPMGVNIVANAAIQSIAATKAFGGQFVRVNQWANAYIANEGFVEGASGVALRYRSMLEGEDIHVFADVHVKHGSHAIVADRPIEELARDAAFFGASSLIATGFRTGDPTKVEEVFAVKKGSDLPVLVGSGIDAGNCQELLKVADGAILGVSVKEPNLMSGKTNVAKLKEFMSRVRELRETL
ncbi:BtpA/SgcQ family protein [Paenibacillus sp. YSY-4.3]